MPEAANHGISDNGRAVCLVVGGEYNGSSTTYYRIDLYDRTPDAAGNISKPTAATRIETCCATTFTWWTLSRSR